MWLLAASASLLPAVLLLSSRYRGEAAALWRRAAAWLLGLLRGRVCVRSTHAFVFTNCTHGKVHSVLETFDLYTKTHPSASVGPQIGELLDEVVGRLRPLLVLELGMHCAYSSVRLLRLMPPAGRLITVELDPVTADLGEEIILVSGFKHSQFQVLACSSAEAISNMPSHLEPHEKTGAGFSLVLMDHDPEQYLPDLLSLERQQLLCPSGCSLLLVKRDQRSAGLGRVLDHIRGQADRYSVTRDLQVLTEVFYRTDGLTARST
ncbi:transmembrane O-methyltransferase homolog [Salarias fasciatus]|uniref:catechol O-methyltransferase n=1 Tax=Salarias fasciatus TaxID=181472 RepID=A0A672GAX9_SALFA|nr:transmembrane O-methyltransferase homolog [Salarias fasciatus]